ncbi:hypothetical protein AB0M20_10815 [Actinoplanes sp. NPDC051633]|uniref:hypothetical protein n=1 Tax=Actinoplanes sp. NPDC051633 TaxID=3155670 RepID=UPI00343AE7A1
MSDLRDLMSSVTTDLAAVRWSTADELRRRVRTRRRRTIAAAAGAVAAVAVGVAAFAAPGQRPPTVPSTPTAPTVQASTAAPVEIPRSVLLTARDVKAGPDSQDDGADAFQPVQIPEFMACDRQRNGKLPAQTPRFSRGITHLLGTQENRPERPFLVGQQVYRFAAPDADGFLRDLRSAVSSCDGLTMTGDVPAKGGKTVRVRATHSWSIIAEGFAGDDSLVIKHDVAGHNVATGKLVSAGTAEQVAYVRVGDLVTRVSARSGTDLDEVRRLSTVAAGRLCVAANPRC